MFFDICAGKYLKPYQGLKLKEDDARLSGARNTEQVTPENT